ncbi:MAG: PIG-L family deacetylase [Chloroflexi bacterium]|nr:PIG-L family deacetylase [Chloroflexota bacterium]
MTAYIYLSPHFDDVALSCGGMVLKHAQRGEVATVLTVCAGEPDYANLSEFALMQHQRWGAPPDPIATRRAEDEEAMRRLGAKGVYLDFLDGIYRRGPKGQPIVASERSLFAGLKVKEQYLVGAVAGYVRDLAPDPASTIVVAPLAVGRHVDHCLTRDAARVLAGEGYRVTWYEDFPYCEKANSVARARAVAFTEFEKSVWDYVRYPIDLPRKIHAVAAYASQMNSTFKGEADMAARVTAYSTASTHGRWGEERLWEIWKKAGHTGTLVGRWRWVGGEAMTVHSGVAWDIGGNGLIIFPTEAPRGD